MIGVLRPQQSSSGSRGGKESSAACDKKSKKDRRAQHKHLASKHGDRHLAGLASAGKRVTGALATRPSSPELPGAGCDGFGSSGNEGTMCQWGPDHLCVGVVQSADDGHQLQELSGDAEIGTLCVAVVGRSSSDAHRAVLKTSKTRAVASPARLSDGTAGRISALSAVVSAMRTLLRLPVETCAPRARGGGQQHPGERLVLFCKLAGEVIMASPLEGSAFRLQLQRDIGEEGVNERNSGDDRQRDIGEEGVNERNSGDDRQQCWTLPKAGFEALRDLENSVVPGLPSLAKDMAKDKNLWEKQGEEFTRPVDEDILVRLRGDGCHGPKRYVVMPRTTGIVFATLDPGAARAVRRGTSNSCAVPPTLVMARLEEEERTGPRESMVVQHRFVLKDLDAIGGGRGGDDEGGDQSSATERGKAGARYRKRKNPRRAARRVSMPVTYAALLEEATLPSPSAGPSFGSSIWNRWRGGHAYRAGGNQVVPGLGEDNGLEDEHRQVRSRAERGGRTENSDGADGVPAIGVSTSHHSSFSLRQQRQQRGRLTVRDVQSASLDDAAAWASKPDVMWALLAAACCSGGDGGIIPTEARAGEWERRSCCVEAREAACTLLERVLGNGVTDRGSGEETTAIGEGKSSKVIGQWYEGFCSVTAPSCGGGGGGGSQQGQIPALILHEAPRLLLHQMLKNPTVKKGFVERGLARHLAEVLRTASAETKETEKGSDDHRHRACPGGTVDVVGEPQLREDDVSNPCPRVDERNLWHGKCDAGNPRAPCGSNRPRLPWWLLFKHGRNKEEDDLGHDYKHMQEREDANQREREHGADDAAIPGGSADGRSTSEIDERSCMTTLDEMSAAGEERKGHESDTSRKLDPVSTRSHEDGQDGTTGDHSVVSAGTAPTSNSVDQRECQERDGAARPGDAGNACSSRKERVSPPLLRLDALDSILDTKEWACPQPCSSHAAVILSAASTRAAPEHLPTFLSARGSTSRASARHGGGRSARTGRTTQREAASPGASVLSEGVAHSVVSEPGAAHPTRSSSRVAREETNDMHHAHKGVANRGCLDPSTDSTSEHSCRHARAVIPAGDVNDTAVDSSEMDKGGCSRAPISCPTSLVLNLACDSARGRALWDSSPPTRQKDHLRSSCVLLDAKVSVARLLVSLLPSTPIEHSPEDSLVAALDVLSSAGALAWIDEGACEPCCSEPKLGPARSHGDTMRGTGRESPLPLWVRELDRVDIVLLFQAGEMHLRLRTASLRSQSQRSCQDSEDGRGMMSTSHQRRVHRACLVGVECVWVTRLLRRRVAATSELDDEWRSALSPEATTAAVRFCGRALEIWSRSLHSLSSRQSPRLRAIHDSVRSDEGSQDLSQGSDEIFEESTGPTADFFLLTAPMVVELGELLVALIGKSSGWGENLHWAAQTLDSATFCLEGNGGALPILVGLLHCLAGSAPTEDGNNRHYAGVEEGEQQSKPCASCAVREATERLELKLHGRKAVFQQAWTAAADSVAAILYRSRTLSETLYDIPLDTSDTDASEEEPPGKGIMGVRQAVSRVWTETAPIFRRGGPILAVLEARLPLTFDDQAEWNPSGAVLPGRSPVSSIISSTYLAATLRLSSAFFSLCGQTAGGDETGLRGLQHFVAPLFSGFRQRWDGIARGLIVGASDAGRQSMEEELRTERTVSGSDREVLLCRLHLEALARLADIVDPDVQTQLRECRVAPFLLQGLLAVDVGATGTPEEAVESPRPVHGFLRYSSSCSALQPHKGPPPNTSAHRPLQSGRGLDSSAVQSGTRMRSYPTRSSGHTAEGAPRRSGAISTVAADGANSYSVGDRVDGLVPVRTGRPRWFPGRVESVHEEDGTVHVCYDDGDEEAGKDPAKVRPRRTVDRRSGSRIRNSSGGQTEAVAPATAATVPPPLRPSKDREDVAATPERLMPGRLQLRSSAADSTGLRSDVVSIGLGDRRASTADFSASIKDPTSGVGISDSRKGACSNIRNGKRQPQSRLSLAADVKMTTNSEGDTFYPEAVVDAAEDGERTAESDRKDDDAYFEIPTVFDTAGTADNTACPFPMSVVPRIDLQSPVFRTRVVSSQLGPGSSLSTPTTGGTRILETMRTGRASRSEASLATAAALPSGRSSRVSRRPSMNARSSTGSGGPSSRSFPRSVSVLSDHRQSMADDGSSLERELARLLDSKPPALSREGEDDDDEDDKEAVYSAPGAPCSGRKPSGRAKEANCGDGSDVATEASKPRHKSRQLGNDDNPDGPWGGRSPFSLTWHPFYNDLRAMQDCAVSAVLAITASLVTDDPPLASVVAPGEADTTAISDAMATLEKTFDRDRSTHIIPGLKVRWRFGATSRAEPPTAVLAKLVCPALFDARSYSLDGAHIAAGRFGSVIVSKCPLPLGRTPTSRTFGQAPFDHTPLTPTREETGQPTEKTEECVPHDARPNRWLREVGVDGADEVALKVVEREDFDGATGLTVFREALALRALAGVPGVCRLYDFGVTRASYVLVIERCACSLTEWRLARGVHDGGAIELDGDRVSSEVPFSDADVVLYLCVFRQVVSAVAAMAERGVVHFDLKCDNILVRSSSRSSSSSLHGFVAPPTMSAVLQEFLATRQYFVPSVCVADFGESVLGRRKQAWQRPGLAYADPPSEGYETPTTGGTCDDEFRFDIRGTRGTERIQSPEMILSAGAGGNARGVKTQTASSARGYGNEPADIITAASDVWSLGCLLYELLTSKLLFGDLEWSEFFVTVTAGEVAGDRASDRDAKTAPTLPTHPIPSPKSLLPFAGLGSADTLRQLLEAMLVRNPVDRPCASRVVQHVDEALEVVVSSSANRVVKRDKEPPTIQSGSGRRKSNRSTPLDESARGITCEETQELRQNTSNFPLRKQAALHDPSTIESEGQTPSGAETSTTVDNAIPDWALLRPSSAVGAHRDRAVQRLAQERCDGTVYRLGAGAFLLALDSSAKGGSRAEANGAALAWHRLGPESMVCCATPAGGEDPCWMANGTPSLAAAAGPSRCSLGNAISALGINHVVCVISKQGETRDTQEWASGIERSPSHPSRRPGSREPRGVRLLKVHIPVGDTVQEENSRPNDRPSAPCSVKGFVREVQQFATGHRVIFVGVDCERDVAGAVAVAWAMNRTGKGVYETMLRFRQEFAGFWVDLATLQTVIGEATIE